MAKKGENFLDYTPAISPRHTWSEKDGKVTIHMEHRGFYPWIAQKFFKRPRISHIDLDAQGSFVYRHINGERTVEELAQLFAALSAEPGIHSVEYDWETYAF